MKYSKKTIPVLLTIFLASNSFAMQKSLNNEEAKKSESLFSKKLKKKRKKKKGGISMQLGTIEEAIEVAKELPENIKLEGKELIENINREGAELVNFSCKRLETLVFKSCGAIGGTVLCLIVLHYFLYGKKPPLAFLYKKSREVT